MKKRIIPMLLVLVLLLSGCSQAIPVDTRIQISLMDAAGYTVEEKIAIAQRYLVPKQCEANGLKDKKVVIRKTSDNDL